MSDRLYSALVLMLWLLVGNQSVFAVQIDDINAPSSGRGDASERNNVVVTPLSPPPEAEANQPSAERGQSQSSATIRNGNDVTPSGNAPLIEMARRQQELQEQVEQLRSANEEMSHTVEKLQTRLRDMYKDLDNRIQEVEKKASAAVQAPASVNGAIDGSAPVAVAGDTAAERKAYEHAFNLLREKQYDQSIAGFQSFLKTYPHSEFADNAQYWIGESYYVKGDFKQSANSFKAMIATYPQSGKLADAYMKLGFAQYELGQNKEARQSLNWVVKQSGNSTAARLAKERLDRMSKEGR